MLGLPATENVFFELQESDIVQSLIHLDWSVLNDAERLRDWHSQPAIFVGIGRCDTCDGPFTLLGEVHGQATNGTLYLGTVFSIEIGKKPGLELLETAIDRNLLANDAMYDRAVEFCKTLGSSKNFAQVALVRQQREKAHKFGQQGMTALQKGKLDQAEENLNSALQIFEELDERKAQAITCMNLGILYINREQLDRSEILLKRSLVIFEQINSQTDLAVVYGILGELHCSRKEFDQAEQDFHKSLEIDRELNDKHGIAAAYYSLGNVYKERDERQRARETYAEALKVWTELGDRAQAKVAQAELDRLNS